MSGGVVLDPNRPLRVLYLGTAGEFSRAALLSLLDAGVAICGVVIPAAAGAPSARLAPERSRSPLPIANPYLSPGILQIAWERGIATIAAGPLADPATAALLAEAQPDLACVACFPRRIPAALLRPPPLGWLNIHPALLPAYRGPAPLFWSFRNGERATGVTVHFLDEQLDTGDIAAQAPIGFPDGTSSVEADRMAATLGARLLAQTLDQLRRGTLARHAQPAGGSYYGWPTPQDWMISTAWPARRAFNFMRGTSDWGQPYPIEAGGKRLPLASAIDYAPDATLGTPYRREGRKLAIQCTPGVLWAWIADSADVSRIV